MVIFLFLVILFLASTLCFLLGVFLTAGATEKRLRDEAAKAAPHGPTWSPAFPRSAP